MQFKYLRWVGYIFVAAEVKVCMILHILAGIFGLNTDMYVTCGVDQVIGRLMLFASQCGDTRNPDEHWHAVYDLSGNGPASLVVPRHPAPLQRRGILKWHIWKNNYTIHQLTLLDTFNWRILWWSQTAWRVTFRSGTVTRHGTMTCVEKRVIKMVSRSFLLPLLRKGCSGSGFRQKQGAVKGTPWYQPG